MTPPPDQHYLSIQGQAVPAIGLGTWQLTGGPCIRAVAHGVEVGYRHIDTAQLYDNEADVGRGIAESRMDRASLFLTTKLAHGNLRRSAVRRSFEESLRRLQTDYVDLLLIHWPDEEVPLEETLEAMTNLQRRGMLHHIGVSNFPPSRLARARRIANIFCNQVEYHPLLSQDRLLGAVRDEGLLFTAYSPLARGRVLKDQTLRQIAESKGKSPAQVTLRWLLQQEIAAIPKASSAPHRQNNLDIFDFSLSDDEMRRIFEIGGDTRLIDPDWAPHWERSSSAS